mmetsp:Transcript_48814/g.140098  ORF Transcript_48814/g.140098 Transcript_48814/m.140098 type:complete len:249 (-) Transcript_48814:171-917(-)
MAPGTNSGALAVKPPGTKTGAFVVKVQLLLPKAGPAEAAAAEALTPLPSVAWRAEAMASAAVADEPETTEAQARGPVPLPVLPLPLPLAALLAGDAAFGGDAGVSFGDFPACTAGGGVICRWGSLLRPAPPFFGGAAATVAAAAATCGAFSACFVGDAGETLPAERLPSKAGTLRMARLAPPFLASWTKFSKSMTYCWPFTRHSKVVQPTASASKISFSVASSYLVQALPASAWSSQRTGGEEAPPAS